MPWIYFALLSAIIWGFTSLVAKKILSDTSSLIHSTAVIYFLTGFYTLYFLGTGHNLVLGETPLALAAMAVSVAGNISGFLLYNYALKIGDVSAVMPIRRLTPIFTAVIAAIAIGETLTVISAIGVALATAGIFIVAGRPRKLIDEKLELEISKEALIAALGAAMVYGFTSTADRFATQSISPETYTLAINLGMFSAYTLILLRRPGERFHRLGNRVRNYLSYYLLLGLFGAVASLSVFKAFSLGKAALVTTVLQLQVIIPVIGGAVIFNEEQLGKRLLGSAIVLSGIALTVI